MGYIDPNGHERLVRGDYSDDSEHAGYDNKNMNSNALIILLHGFIRAIQEQVEKIVLLKLGWADYSEAVEVLRMKYRFSLTGSIRYPEAASGATLLKFTR
ncbi:hypothetical protein [Paenibacillus durus]|uniref:Uncharacterized protein n=1 Tax=Paenibacillus durus TaxID=44251 RepID=A0A089HW09_PAEDU|nr:hypothetical protein [Paenibacillus durus]AIQ14543.1 hypothetical protein PDUR_23620 [Paenibacillus durus]